MEISIFWSATNPVYFSMLTKKRKTITVLMEEFEITLKLE